MRDGKPRCHHQFRSGLTNKMPLLSELIGSWVQVLQTCRAYSVKKGQHRLGAQDESLVAFRDHFLTGR